MELRQLRALVTLVEHDYNVSKAAARLNLVQSAVSQQISKLEAELGMPLFLRHGKRLIGLTDMGQKIIGYAYRSLATIENIYEVGREQVSIGEGILRVGVTHLQARYILPSVVKQFQAHYPTVELVVHQGTPQQLVEKVIRDEVDFSVCTEALALHHDLLTIPCYRWNRSLIALVGAPILSLERITLKALSSVPLVTYVQGFTGCAAFIDTFERVGLRPKVVLNASDTDVIKTYVREGLGAGVIASLAYAEDEDQDLVRRDLSQLFPWATARIAYQKDKFIRRHQRYFIDLLLKTVQQPGRWHGLMPSE